MKNASRYKKEVLQGFKTAGNLLLGFFTLVCLLGGIAGLSGSDPRRFGILGDSVALVVALSILFATAHRWGRWIGGFFGIPGGLKSLIVLSSGHALNSPDKPVPRIEAVSVLMFSALLVMLTYPLIVSHRAMKATDRACLVGATITFGFGIVGQQQFYVWMWMVPCLLFLLILRFALRSNAILTLRLDSRVQLASNPPGFDRRPLTSVVWRILSVSVKVYQCPY